MTAITDSILAEKDQETSVGGRVGGGDAEAEGDEILRRVLSLDRRMAQWDSDAVKLANITQLVDDVTKRNTEVGG